MKLAAIIKELEKLDNQIGDGDFSTHLKKDRELNARLVGIASAAIKSIPLSACKINELTGILKPHISYLKNGTDTQIRSSTLIKIMLKLGYEAEITFTKL